MKVCLQTKCEESTHAEGRLYRGKSTGMLFLGVDGNRVLDLRHMSVRPWTDGCRTAYESLSPGSRILLKSEV